MMLALKLKNQSIIEIKCAVNLKSLTKVEYRSADAK
jgi:hypothetical protein